MESYEIWRQLLKYFWASACLILFNTGHVCTCQCKMFGGLTFFWTHYVFFGKFYGSFNNILNVLGKRRNDMLAVHLIKTYYLPMLLYSCEIWGGGRPVDMRSVDVSWNNAFRKIFNACWRESVKPLQLYCSCLPASVLVHQRSILFG